MELNEYQDRAHETSHNTVVGSNNEWLYPLLGLAGEAGELANKAKKIFRDEGDYVSDESKAAFLLELGDVLWYVAELATQLDATLEDVAAQNLAKLRSRANRGVIGGSGDNR